MALPVRHWSTTQGVRWKVAVPGQGHASPIVAGDRVIVSTADEQAQTRSGLCYSRQTGALLWNTVLHTGGFLSKHDKNTHASPTPACDGLRVFIPYVAGDALWLSALDLDGRIVWQPRIGSFVSEHGYASSPVLYKDLVIVTGDNQGSPAGQEPAATSYLAGVRRETGEIAWRVSRPLAPSYGTPVVANLAGRDQLVLGGPQRITAYDPATGKELWFCRWSGERAANSVVCGGDRVYASVTWRQPEIVCVRADGNGDVTDSHLVWREKHGASDVPSPLYHKGRLYLVNDRGMATCLDTATGQQVWQQRLGMGFSASPVLAGDCILATDEAGTTHLLQAGDRFVRVGQNSLRDPILASPALAGDHLFLRSEHFLWCLDGTTVAQPARQPQVVPVTARQAAPAAPAAAKEEEDDSAWLLVAAVLSAVAFGLLFGIGFLFVGRRRRAGEMPLPPPVKEKHAEVEAAGSFIHFQCSGCRKKLRGKEQLAGKRVKCPQCAKAVLVPSVWAG